MSAAPETAAIDAPSLPAGAGLWDVQGHMAARLGGTAADYFHGRPETRAAAEKLGIVSQWEAAVEASEAIAPNITASIDRAQRTEKRAAPAIVFDRGEPGVPSPGPITRNRPGAILASPTPIKWGALADKEPPPRRWAIGGWVGFGHVTLLVGLGGIGKTLLAQQVESALAVNAHFIDEVRGPLRTLAWHCEDDADELWRRQVSIARWLDAGLDAFTENLFVVARHGRDNALATTEFGRLMFTPRLEELREQAEDLKAEVIVLDNVAQLFGGNENDRHSVTAFLNALAGALPGRAILLLAHPARSAGSEFSGSSAWENTARTRLYLGDRLPDEKRDQDEEPAEDVRYLSRRKANYSTKDWRRFTYRDGVLVPDPMEASGGMLNHLRAGRTERTLLAAARRLAEMGVRLTDGSTSPQFLPRLVLEYKLGEGATKRELADAMRSAILDGRLTREQVGRYANRLPMFGLKVAA